MDGDNPQVLAQRLERSERGSWLSIETLGVITKGRQSLETLGVPTKGRKSLTWLLENATMWRSFLSRYVDIVEQQQG